MPDPEPEVLMQMAERSEVLFKLYEFYLHIRWVLVVREIYILCILSCRVRKGRVFNCQVISRVLPLILMDFLPPSEILNRVIAEFLSPSQTCPELVAPTIAQVSWLQIGNINLKFVYQVQ